MIHKNLQWLQFAIQQYLPPGVNLPQVNNHCSSMIRKTELHAFYIHLL